MTKLFQNMLSAIPHVEKISVFPEIWTDWIPRSSSLPRKTKVIVLAGKRQLEKKKSLINIDIPSKEKIKEIIVGGQMRPMRIIDFNWEKWNIESFNLTKKILLYEYFCL